MSVGADLRRLVGAGGEAVDGTLKFAAILARRGSPRFLLGAEIEHVLGLPPLTLRLPHGGTMVDYARHAVWYRGATFECYLPAGIEDHAILSSLVVRAWMSSPLGGGR